MGIREFFQPRWKHADPEVRADAVRKLQDQDAAIVVQVAREDPDPRVRRIALKRVADLSVLGEVASGDPDEGIRAVATEMLIAAATAGEEPRALAALERLKAERDVADVAKRGTLKSARAAALVRLQEARALADVARHGEHAETRIEAIARIGDAPVLRDIALSDSAREVSLAAVARLEDETALESVAERAKAKPARAAARDKLILRRGGSALSSPAELKVREDAIRQARRSQLCRIVENAVNQVNLDTAVAEVAASRQEWSEMGPEGAEEYRARFEAACVRFAAWGEERDREARLRLEAESERARGEAGKARTRETTGETAAGAAATAAAVVAAGAETATPEAATPDAAATPELPVDPAAAAVLTDSAPAATTEARKARRAEAKRPSEDPAVAMTRLEGLLSELESLADASERKRAEDAVRRIRQAFEDKRVAPEVRAQLRARFENARVKAQARLQELHEKEAWERFSNVTKLEELCARVEGLLNEPDPKKAAIELRAAQTEWKQFPPPQARAKELWARFKAASDQVYARCRAHFQALDEERNQNLKKKEELCQRVESFADSTDWKEAAAAIQALREEWKAVGPVPKEQAAAIWQRFRVAADRFFERRKAHFHHAVEGRSEHLQRKEELIAKAESLADSAEWKTTADAIKLLQAEWKKVGPATRSEDQASWKRFRAACDRFFDRRKEHFAQLDVERAANLKAKDDLCLRVEAAAGTVDRDEAVRMVRELMAEWKKVGPAPAEKSDAIWQRFRDACDRLRDTARAPEPKPETARLAADRPVAAGRSRSVGAARPTPAGAGRSVGAGRPTPAGRPAATRSTAPRAASPQPVAAAGETFSNRLPLEALAKRLAQKQAPAPPLPEPPASAASAADAAPSAAAAEPIAPEPIAPEPIAPEPIAPEPIAPEPIAPEPIAPEPIAPEPAGEPLASAPTEGGDKPAE